MSRPYIRGLDEIEFSNLMKGWFKHGGLEAAALRNTDQVPAEQVSEIISAIEATVREELYEYASNLSESQMKLEAFLDGVDFAIRPTKEEDSLF
jgi:chromosome segregation and condensation protein ScpB